MNRVFPPTERLIAKACSIINWNHGRGSFYRISFSRTAAKRGGYAFAGTVTRTIPIDLTSSKSETRKFTVRRVGDKLRLRFLGHTRVLPE